MSSDSHWREAEFEKRRAELEKQYAERAVALDGVVREIHSFEIRSVSLTPAEQALYPSWRALEANTGIRKIEGGKDEQ